MAWMDASFSNANSPTRLMIPSFSLQKEHQKARRQDLHLRLVRSDEKHATENTFKRKKNAALDCRVRMEQKQQRKYSLAGDAHVEACRQIPLQFPLLSQKPMEGERDKRERYGDGEDGGERRGVGVGAK